MKQAGVVLSWVLFVLGIPVMLIIWGFTPYLSLVGTKSNLFEGNLEVFLLHFASVLLWLIWLYGSCAFMFDLWKLKTYRTTSTASLGFRRWSMMGAMAVWSLLLASYTLAKTNKSNSTNSALDDVQQVISEIEAGPVELPSPTPLAFSASTVLVVGILQLVQYRRERILQSSVPHSKIQPLSCRSQLILKELQLVATTTSGEGIRKVMDGLMESDSSPILSSWRPNSTLCAVLPRSKCTMDGPPLSCVPLGLAHGEVILLTIARGEVFAVDLDAGGRARSVLAHLAQSIILETLGSNTNVIAFGFGDIQLVDAPHLAFVNSMVQLVEHVLNTRSSSQTIVCSADPLSMESLSQLREMGCGVVTASNDHAVKVDLVYTKHGWSVVSTDLLISLYGISLEENAAISRLIDEVSRPTTVPAVIDRFTIPRSWKVIIRLLGPVEAVTHDGVAIRFEKSKSVELLAWLTTHRSRPTRSAARTALWEINVQDSTFTNVVSDVRRGLRKAVQLSDIEDWLPRTLTDALPLHMSVTTDAELMDASIHHAACLNSDTALAELRDALEYVRDLPFAGSNYIWPDAEGITTQLTLSVMTSAVMASELYLERGDTEGVFWATSRGLRVLPGHEELLALRMRAHALKGDLAAVRAEWNSHQRATARDMWSGGATSPKLNELCRTLLQVPPQSVYSVSE